MQTKLILTTLIFMISTFFFGCATYEPGKAPDYDIYGTKPSYTEKKLHKFVHNERILTIIWVPDIDKKFVPQGLTIADGFILLAGYSSLKGGPAPTKILKISPQNGEVVAQFKLPEKIHHGDGLAYAGNSILWIVDNTGTVLKIDIEKAFRQGSANNAILGSFVDIRALELPSTINKFKLRMRTHFCTYDGNNLWLGRWAAKGGRLKIEGMGPPKVYKIDQEKALENGRFDNSVILDSFEIAYFTQGAGWDGYNLWLSQGAGKKGQIQKIDQNSKGKVLKEIRLTPGAEDIGFSPDGSLWISFEAGAMKYKTWPTYFPLIIQLNVN